FRGNGGADVSARWFPHPGMRGAVVLAHPDRRYAQHWFVREGWIDWLHGHGFAALTFDFANYGGTRGGSTYLFEDCIAAVEQAHVRAGGVPVHAVGLSIGAFSLANASPDVALDGLVLESPYPSFNSWYEGDGHRVGRTAMAAFDRLFPRTSALIQADERIRHARARRILVAASKADEVTPAALSRRVAQAAPAGRSRYLELGSGAHLSFFRESAAYRDAVLATLAPASTADAPPAAAPSSAPWTMADAAVPGTPEAV
ncbi:MAG TPA: hypothetical protein VFH47_09130, partial [Candidatus Thermoplasmatota archaeon]|nr:hypothetical protein [Candidatus Thermoplasmatota archaeon]